ncbi:MAG: hypothetical protein AABY18_07435 [Candidatus Thermoplasmatota archaeon]
MVASNADGRSVAWLSYVPLPGLALAAVAARPRDRLVRFHAWQGTLAILGLLVFLFLTGLAARLSEARAYRLSLGLLSGLGLLAGFVQLGWGIAGAATGRYVRLRPWWDLAAMLKQPT